MASSSLEAGDASEALELSAESPELLAVWLCVLGWRGFTTMALN